MPFTITNNTGGTATYAGQSVPNAGTLVPSSGTLADVANDPSLVADLLSGLATITIGANTWSGKIAVNVLQFVASGLAVDGRYSTYVSVRQTAATAANATVFSIRNPVGSGKTMFIDRINLILSFDSATPVTRSTFRYSLVGFSAATPTGGTAQTAAKLDSTHAASIGPDIRSLDTGLTTTGVSFNNTITAVSCPTCDGAVSYYTKGKQDYVIKLAPGEGLAIRLFVAAVIGQGISGEIVWSER